MEVVSLKTKSITSNSKLLNDSDYSFKVSYKFKINNFQKTKVQMKKHKCKKLSLDGSNNDFIWF